MKTISLLSVIDAYRTLDKPLFQKLMNSYGIMAGGMNGIKDYELDCIEALVNRLCETGHDLSVVNDFYLGYSIPQIGKEFDLLRFGDNYIINIELKTQSTPEKIRKQQEKNKYYLSFLEQETYIYTYVTDENKLYKLSTDREEDCLLEEASFTELCNKLSNQEITELSNIDGLFNPSDYLVSPFNTPDKFMEGNYFLTIQQEQIYKSIQKDLADPALNLITLTGDAGTGKTLLTYHLAKEAMKEGQSVLVLHCAQLNEGQIRLNKHYGWHIYMSKYAPDLKEHSLIIIDEAQRMDPDLFRVYINSANTMNTPLLLSYDEKQYLKEQEKASNIQIKKEIDAEWAYTSYKLTGKVRTNREIAYFITQLFDNKSNIPDIAFSNIELMYCKDNASAVILLHTLHRKGWKTPNYTPSVYDSSHFFYEKYASEDADTAHSVIGQEFDKVAVVIDEHFNYDADGRLVADNSYYLQNQMLYQTITRTRKKLCVIVLNNEQMLNRCIRILNK